MQSNDFGSRRNTLTGPNFNDGVSSPEIMNDKQESIFNSLLLIAGAAAAGAFIVKSLQNEKSHGWQLVGFFGLTGSYFGVLRGVTNILYHFCDKCDKNTAPTAAVAPPKQ